jgi:hypothetical protein
MARAKHPRPLLIGPDVDGRWLVVAGDRVCWFGMGEPPQTPGALRLDAGGGAIQGGAALELETGGKLDPASAVTSVILVGGPDALEAEIHPMRARGVRVVAAVRVVDALEAQRTRALHASNRDPLVRVGLAPSTWEGVALLAEDIGVPVHSHAHACSEIVARHFGRRADLSPGAMGDAVVTDGAAVRHVVVGGRLVIRDGAALPLFGNSR